MFDWLLTWGEVIGAIGTAVVMAGLVYLYLQQRNILKRSFRASHRAHLEVDRVQPAEDGIQLDLSNVGNGVGLNPELVVIAVYTNHEGEVTDGLTTNRMDRVDGDHRNKMGAVQEGESNVPYEARLSLPYPYGGNRASFRSVLRHEDLDFIRIYLYVRYTDMAEECRSVYVDGWEFNVDDNIEVPADLSTQAVKVWFEFPSFEPESLDYVVDDISRGLEKEVV